MIDRRGTLALPALLAVRPAAAIPPPPPHGVYWQSEPVQGALTIGHAQPGARITLAERPVRVLPNGRFVVGFGRDAPATLPVSVTPTGLPRRTFDLAIARRSWPVQRLDGLPGAMVTPPAETLARIRAEQQKLGAVRQTDSAEPHFLNAEGFAFAWPAQGRISGVYGSQRILNGQPRAPHLGLDVAAPTGTPVRAAAAGRVLLAEDLYFTGNTVILDHGLGVQTLHAHFSRIDVAVGEAVTQGQVVGAIGATGRVTGPHLHFAVNWFATPVDPQLLLPR